MILQNKQNSNSSFFKAVLSNFYLPCKLLHIFVYSKLLDINIVFFLVNEHKYSKCHLGVHIKYVYPKKEKFITCSHSTFLFSRKLVD